MHAKASNDHTNYIYSMRMQNLTPHHSPLISTLCSIKSLIVASLFFYFLFFYHLFLFWMENFHTHFACQRWTWTIYYCYSCNPTLWQRIHQFTLFLCGKTWPKLQFWMYFSFFKYPPWLLEVVESRKLWFWVAGKDYFSHFNLKVFLPLHASSAFVLLCFFHFL